MIKWANRADAENCERIVYSDDGLGGQDKIEHYGK
jgi:hypothetical protein